MIEDVFIHSISKCIDTKFTRIFYYPCIDSNKSYYGIPYHLQSFKVKIDFETLKDFIDFYEPYELYCDNLGKVKAFGCENKFKFVVNDEHYCPIHDDALDELMKINFE